jgi:hypothetical protein
MLPLAQTSSTTAIPNSKEPEEQSLRRRRVSILICPAQFCVPSDYDTMIQDLQEFFRHGEVEQPSIELGTCRVVTLPRTEWIKVAQSLPTKEYLDGTLVTRKTVSWYYNAIEEALCDILAAQHTTNNTTSNGMDHSICIIGHSIGGWIARGYLGGLSFSSTAIHRKVMQNQSLVSSFITLGTPHSSPDTALVDQTRGLLREVEQTVQCSSSYLVNTRGIQVTNVCSAGVQGKLFSTNVEEFVAAASYIPLVGLPSPSSFSNALKGDGIVPLQLGLMDQPANHVILERSDACGTLIRHASVIPTPWNLLDASAKSIPLPEDFLWYGSKTVLPQWAKYIQ